MAMQIGAGSTWEQTLRLWGEQEILTIEYRKLKRIDKRQEARGQRPPELWEENYKLHSQVSWCLSFLVWHQWALQWPCSALCVPQETTAMSIWSQYLVFSCHPPCCLWWHHNFSRWLKPPQIWNHRIRAKLKHQIMRGYLKSWIHVAVCRSVGAPDYKYRWRGRNRSPILLTIIILLIVRAGGGGRSGLVTHTIWHWPGTGAGDGFSILWNMKLLAGAGVLGFTWPDRIRDVRTAEPPCQRDEMTKQF